MTCVEYLSGLNGILTKYDDLTPNELNMASNTAFIKSIAYSLAVIADKLSEEGGKKTNERDS